MGIDCGVKSVFQDEDNRFIYTLDWNNKVTPLHEIREEKSVTSTFASSSNPKDISKCVLRYGDCFIKGGNKVKPKEPIRFKPDQSVIRIYRDIFLLFDTNTKKWVLSRIIIP